MCNGAYRIIEHVNKNLTTSESAFTFEDATEIDTTETDVTDTSDYDDENTNFDLGLDFPFNSTTEIGNEDANSSSISYWLSAFVVLLAFSCIIYGVYENFFKKGASIEDAQGDEEQELYFLGTNNHDKTNELSKNAESVLLINSTTSGDEKSIEMQTITFGTFDKNYAQNIEPIVQSNEIDYSGRSMDSGSENCDNQSSAST